MDSLSCMNSEDLYTVYHAALPFANVPPPVRFLDLGEDIHEAIFSHIDLRQDLVEHALICRQLTPIAQKQLFYEITIDSEDSNTTYDLHDLCTLEGGSKLLGYVRKMIIRDDEGVWDTGAGYIIDILRHVKLVEFVIDMDMKRKEIAKVARVLDVTRFKRLEMPRQVDMKRWLPILAKVAPKLQILDMKLSNGTPKHASIPYPVFPSLKLLHVDGSEAWWYIYHDSYGEHETYSDEGSAIDDETADVDAETGEEADGWEDYQESEEDREGRRRRPAWRDFNDLQSLVRNSPLLRRIVQGVVPPSCTAALKSYCEDKDVSVIFEEVDSPAEDPACQAERQEILLKLLRGIAQMEQERKEISHSAALVQTQKSEAGTVLPAITHRVKKTCCIVA